MLYAISVGLLIPDNIMIALILSILPFMMYLVSNLKKISIKLFSMWLIFIPFTSVLSIEMFSKKLSLIDFTTFILGAILILLILGKYHKIENPDITLILFMLSLIFIYSITLSKFQFDRFSHLVISDWNQGNNVLTRAIVSNIRIICPLFTVLFLSIFIRSKEDVYRNLRIFSIGIIIACIYGIYEYVVRVSGLGQAFLLPGHSSDIIMGYGTFRISGPFGEPGYYAGFLSLSIIMTLLMKRKEIISSKYFYFLILIQLFNIIFTLSTIGWLSLIIGVSYILFKDKGIKSKAFVLFVLVVSIVMIFTNDVAFQVVTKPFAEQQDVGFESQTERSNSAVAALKIFKDYPIIGIGNGMFGLLYDSYKPLGLTLKPGQPIVNNVYLDILSAYGLLGIIPFLFITYTLLKNLKLIKKHEGKEDYYKYLMGGMLSISIVFFAYPTFNYTFHWFFFGIVIVMPRIIKLEGENKN